MNKTESPKENNNSEEIIKEDCYEQVYPITFNMPDGSTILIAGKEDYADIKAWYTVNPAATEKPTLQYPVDVISYGKMITINNNVARSISTTDKVLLRWFLFLFFNFI